MHVLEPCVHFYASPKITLYHSFLFLLRRSIVRFAPAKKKYLQIQCEFIATPRAFHLISKNVMLNKKLNAPFFVENIANKYTVFNVFCHIRRTNNLSQIINQVILPTNFNLYVTNHNISEKCENDKDYLTKLLLRTYIRFFTVIMHITEDFTDFNNLEIYSREKVSINHRPVAHSRGKSKTHVEQNKNVLPKSPHVLAS